MGKRIVIAVTNDLVTDQRVNRISNTLMKNGYDIQLVGRELQHSASLHLNVKLKRFKLLFNSGALFYANYNCRLFIYLIFNKFDIVLSNDLDTLPASFLASKLKGKQLVYDSHEYFTEVPELVGRKFQQNTWKRIEKSMVPKIKYAYTVCQSIADTYKELYKTHFEVIRNLPDQKIKTIKSESAKEKIVIYQGALNLGRGIELMIQAMAHLNNTSLWIAGAGDIEQDLKQLVDSLGLNTKVKFLGRIPFSELHEYTQQASLGLSLEENIGLNYYFALPNKLFDYIQAKIPVLVSDLPEMRNVVTEYKVGDILLERTPNALATKIESILTDSDSRVKWDQYLEKAAEELVWENEQKRLVSLFSSIV